MDYTNNADLNNIVNMSPEIQDMLDDLTIWAERVGLEKSTPEKQVIKVMEEVGELAHHLLRGNKEEVIDAIGDIIGALNTLCLQLNISLYECIEQCHRTVTKRKGKMINGVFIKADEEIDREADKWFAKNMPLKTKRLDLKDDRI